MQNSAYNVNDSINMMSVERELRKFNWGAFIFGVIWGIFNKAFKITFLLSLILFFTIGVCIWILMSNVISGNTSNFLPYIVSIVILAITMIFIPVYIGTSGNRWAWEGKKWDSIEHFTHVQKNWAIAALICWLAFYILPVVGSILLFGTSMLVMLNQLGSIDGEASITGINQVVPEENLVINSFLSENNFVNARSAGDMAEFIVSGYIDPDGRKYLFYNSTSVVLRDDEGFEPVKKVYSFNKQKGLCNLEKKNCSVSYYEIGAEGVAPVSKTYFDSTGATKIVKLVKKK